MVGGQGDNRGGWRRYLRPFRGIPGIRQLLRLGNRRAHPLGSLPQPGRDAQVMNNASLAAQNAEAHQVEIRRAVDEVKGNLESIRQQEAPANQRVLVQIVNDVKAAGPSAGPPAGPPLRGGAVDGSFMSRDRRALIRDTNHPEYSLPAFYWRVSSLFLPRAEPLVPDPPLPMPEVRPEEIGLGEEAYSKK